MKQRIRLTEADLHRIIRESVRGILNEISPELAAAYSQGRMAQGKYDKASEGEEYARNLWNNEYGYNDNGNGRSYEMNPWSCTGDKYATDFYYPGAGGYTNHEHYLPSQDVNHETRYSQARYCHNNKPAGVRRFDDQTHGVARNGNPNEGDSVAYRMNNINWEDVQDYLKNHPDKQEFLKTIQQRKPESWRNRGY